jgi:hypothetical protein
MAKQKETTVEETTVEETTVEETPKRPVSLLVANLVASGMSLTEALEKANGN